MLMLKLQEAIHKLETGPRMQQVKTGVAVLALLGLVMGQLPFIPEFWHPGGD